MALCRNTVISMNGRAAMLGADLLSLQDLGLDHSPAAIPPNLNLRQGTSTGAL